MVPDSSRTSDLPSSRRPLSASASPSLSLEVASRSDPGLEREQNEDNLLVTSFGASTRRLAGTTRIQIEPPGWALLAVCDGMGGANAGEVASQMAVNLLEDAMVRAGAADSPAALGRRLVRSLEEASRLIHQKGAERPSLAGMGTTATACVLAGSTLYIGQIADSRAYLLRRGRLTQLTRDQTLATLMMESGQLAPEDLDSFAFGHVILQAVGVADRIEVDLRELSVCAGDILLVCSDGLHGPVSSSQIRATLEREPSPAAACEALIALALEAGGPDNISCVVARIEGSALPLPTCEVRIERAVVPSDPPIPIPTAESAPPSIEDEDTLPPSTPPSMLAKIRSFFTR